MFNRKQVSKYNSIVFDFNRFRVGLACVLVKMKNEVKGVSRSFYQQQKKNGDTPQQVLNIERKKRGEEGFVNRMPTLSRTLFVVPMFDGGNNCYFFVKVLVAENDLLRALK
eukprot:TRINITY_DN713_c0_g3_i1.p2 TRINITY_DN713_c0_g3~~TRINITY_DN713_c0_g3_i1.p2  ORF type:complete len:111 (+),score=18.54 TRINITY_DN713_c0_g3_i1:725-1057(+)